MGRATMTDDAGKLVLRLSVGVLMLLHGIHKLLHGVDGIGGMLAGMGLPTVPAYGVYLGAVVGPLLVTLGLYNRLGALLTFGSASCRAGRISTSRSRWAPYH